MFGHHGNQLSYHYFWDNPTAEPTFLLPPLAIPNNDHDSVLAFIRSELEYSSSGCSSYISSPTSITTYGTYSPTSIQRSISSHCLQKNQQVYSPVNSSGYYESEISSVRKVLSTGDLEGVNLAQDNQWSNIPLASKSSIIESMGRASRYSPEEKKERIERYRSKRNLRNFNKKIKYECRKTLADSRPRVRGRFARNDETEKAFQSPWYHTSVEEDDEGRFARNDETEKAFQSPWYHTGVEEDDEGDDNWISFLDAFSANLMP